MSLKTRPCLNESRLAVLRLRLLLPAGVTLQQTSLEMTRGVKQPWALYKLHFYCTFSHRHPLLAVCMWGYSYEMERTRIYSAWWWRQDSHKHTPGGPSGTEITATAARWQNRASHFGDFYHLLALLHISLCSLQIRSCLTDARQFSQSAMCLLYLHCKYSSVVTLLHDVQYS